MLTTREASFAALEAQVREIKAQLDACLAEAKVACQLERVGISQNDHFELPVCDSRGRSEQP